MEEENSLAFSPTPTIESKENPFVFIQDVAKKPCTATSGYEVGNQNNVMTNSCKLDSF